jgi:3'-phosphoadenosine 5'-phosphosulfate sulfotransferase (PAPS reductase)/FAD synthetase
MQAGGVSGAPGGVLSAEARRALRRALVGRLVAVSFGAGVDSTAMLVALRAAGIRPDVITFADTGGERPETQHARPLLRRSMKRYERRGW